MLVGCATAVSVQQIRLLLMMIKVSRVCRRADPFLLIAQLVDISLVTTGCTSLHNVALQLAYVHHILV